MSNRVILRRQMANQLELGHTDIVATLHCTNIETAHDLEAWLSYGIEKTVGKVFGVDADKVLEYVSNKDTMKTILATVPLD